MIKFIKTMFAGLSNYRLEQERRKIDLEAEIIAISNKEPSISNKKFIWDILNIRHPNMFSEFELDYTIDRMVCDGKLITNGSLYVTPKNKIYIGTAPTYYVGW